MSEIRQPPQQSLFYSPQAYKQSMVDQMHETQFVIDDNQIREQVRMMKQQSPEDEGYMQKFKNLFALKYYQEYFDITTEIVVSRTLNAFNPFSGSFFRIGHGKPDFYGPFWILTTLILEMAALSNLTAYFNDEANFHCQMSMVPMAALIIYGKGLLFPLFIRVLLKCFQCENIQYQHLLCLYGYSSAVTCFCTLFQIIQDSAIQWGLFLYVMFNTTCFIASNLNNELKLLEKDQYRYTLVGTIAVTQISLAIFYKYYFFGGTTQNQQSSIPIKHLTPR